MGVASVLGCLAALPVIYWLELPPSSAGVVIVLAIGVAAALARLIRKPAPKIAPPGANE
jgi:hypothetical protein